MRSLLGVVVRLALACASPLKFMHITKTGGTSIEIVGRRLNLSWGMHHTRAEREYGFWHGLPETKPAEVMRKYEWFTVVRNPYDRLVSEFWCQWGGAGRPANATVASFNAFLVDAIRTRAHRPEGDHYTPQHRYLSLLAVGAGVVLRVLRFERLQQDFARLLKLYRLPQVRLPFANRHASKPLNTSHLTEETVDLIRRTYEADFAIFRYSTRIGRA